MVDFGAGVMHESDERDGFDDDDEGYGEAGLHGVGGIFIVGDPGEEPEGAEEEETPEDGET